MSPILFSLYNRKPLTTMEKSMQTNEQELKSSANVLSLIHAQIYSMFFKNQTQITVIYTVP